MGAAYLPPIRQAFDDISASTAGLFGLKGESSVKLRAPISFSMLNLAPRLARFNQEYPDIEVRIGSSLWADEVEAESYDIDVRFGDGNWSGYHADLLLNEGCIPVCSPNMDPIPHDLESMAKGRLISVMGNEGAWLSAMNISGLTEMNTKRALRADSYMVAAELASSGVGSMLMLKSMAEFYIQQGRLISPVDFELPVTQSHYLLRKEDHRRTKPEITILQQWLINDYQQEFVAE